MEIIDPSMDPSMGVPLNQSAPPWKFAVVFNIGAKRSVRLGVIVCIEALLISLVRPRAILAAELSNVGEHLRRSFLSGLARVIAVFLTFVTPMYLSERRLWMLFPQ